MPILGKKGKAGVKRERDDSDDGPQFHSPGKVNRQWTEEDGKLIKKLKEEDGLTWAFYLLDSGLTEDKLPQNFLAVL